MFKSSIGAVHARFVSRRRASILAGHLLTMLPAQGRVLDVGSGDGMIGRLIADARPQIIIEGIDVRPRPQAWIKVHLCDGKSLPFDDGTFDCLCLVDVLHHTEDPMDLIKEARRVSKGTIVIKDHLAHNAADRALLTFMDWIGNAPHGVALTYNYFSPGEWQSTFSAADLTVEDMLNELNLYPAPFDRIFERRLHFLAKLRPNLARESVADALNGSRRNPPTASEN